MNCLISSAACRESLLTHKPFTNCSRSSSTRRHKQACTCCAVQVTKGRLGRKERHADKTESVKEVSPLLSSPWPAGTHYGSRSDVLGCLLKRDLQQGPILSYLCCCFRPTPLSSLRLPCSAFFSRVRSGKLSSRGDFPSTCFLITIVTWQDQESV